MTYLSSIIIRFLSMHVPAEFSFAAMPHLSGCFSPLYGAIIDSARRIGEKGYGKIWEGIRGFQSLFS